MYKSGHNIIFCKFSNPIFLFVAPIAEACYFFPNSTLQEIAPARNSMASLCACLSSYAVLIIINKMSHN